MNLLLDTHIAIWALNDDEALSEKARDKTFAGQQQRVIRERIDTINR